MSMLSEKSITNIRCSKGYLKICPICNKQFVITYPGTYAYKRRGKYYCGYNCYNTAKKEE